MAAIHSGEFKQDSIGIALTSELKRVAVNLPHILLR